MDIRALFARSAWALVIAGTVLSLAMIFLAGCSPGDQTSTPSSLLAQSAQSTTGTAIPPGPATGFDTFAQRFESLINQRALEGTLPFTVMPVEEVSWLTEAAKPLTVTDANGYRLANGDSVFLFFTTPDFFASTEEVQSTVFPAADESIMAAMQERYPGKPYLRSDPVLGYAIVSAQWTPEYYYQLEDLAGTARHWLPQGG